MKYAGNAAKNMALCINNCIKQLECLQTDYKARVSMSERVRRLVDGKGAERIAKYILYPRQL